MDDDWPLTGKDESPDGRGEKPAVQSGRVRGFQEGVDEACKKTLARTIVSDTDQSVRDRRIPDHVQPAVGRFTVPIPVPHEEDMGPVPQFPCRQRVDADISAQASLAFLDDVSTGDENHMAS